MVVQVDFNGDQIHNGVDVINRVFIRQRIYVLVGEVITKVYLEGQHDV